MAASFQLKSAAALTAATIADIQALGAGITDFSIGAVSRSMIEATMIRIAELYQSAYIGIKQGILTGTYRNFSFSKLPASYATGFITFTLPGAALTTTTVPIGTVARIPNSSLLYTTTAIGTILTGQSAVTVPAIAQTVGSAGNTAANTITQLVSSLSFSVVVANQTPWLNGTDQESDQGRFQRFQSYIAGLSEGTDFAIEAAAQATYLTDDNGNITERVAQVSVVEPFKIGGLLGTVEVWIDNGSGTASVALQEQVTEVLEGYVDASGTPHDGVVASGVRLVVYPVVALPLGINGLIIVAAGYDAATTTTAAETAMADYIGGLGIGASWIKSQSEATALAVVGVTDVQILTPSANVTPVQGQRITPGVVTLVASSGPLST